MNIVSDYILVTGDRNWKNKDVVKKALLDTKLEPSTTMLVHGGCRGADLICAAEAKSLGFNVIEFPALWNKYGLAAGPIRNKQMYDYVKSENHVILVFHDDLKNSKGTKSMVNICGGDKNIKYFTTKK